MSGEIASEVGKLIEQQFKDLEFALSGGEAYIAQFQAEHKDALTETFQPQGMAKVEQALRKELDEERWGPLWSLINEKKASLSRTLQKVEELLGRKPDSAVEVTTAAGRRCEELSSKWSEIKKQAERLSQHVSTEELRSWNMTLDFGPPDGKSEEIAKKALDNGRISQGSILEALRELKMSKTHSGRRPGSKNIEGNGQDITLGLCMLPQQTAAITVGFKKNPYLVRLLVAYFRREHPGEAVTSITVSRNLKLDAHVDDNLGNSYVITLGNFVRGGLWIDQDGKIDEDSEDEYREWTAPEKLPKQGQKGAKDYEKGEHVQGVVLKTHGLLREFNAYYLHKTEDWEADGASDHCDRFTVTYYVSRAVTSAEKASRINLDKMKYELAVAGMVWPTPDQLAMYNSRRSRETHYKKALRPLQQAPQPKRSEDCSQASAEQSKELVAAQKSAIKLLEVNSNQKGGLGTEEVEKHTKRLRTKIGKLNEELKTKSFQLLDKMLQRPGDNGGTFQAKTPGTWRVFVIEVLVVLKMAQKDIQELQVKHRLQDSANSASIDVQKSYAELERVKAEWSGTRLRKRKR